MHRKYDSIAISIKAAEMRFEAFSNRLLAPYDLTGSQFKVLKYVCRQPESSVRQVDIEQYFELRNPTVTLMLQKMEKKGLITRIPDPQDSRCKVVNLTEKAKEMSGEVLALGDRIESEFTKNLTEEKKAQLRELLWDLLEE